MRSDSQIRHALHNGIMLPSIELILYIYLYVMFGDNIMGFQLYLNEHTYVTVIVVNTILGRLN